MLASSHNISILSLMEENQMPLNITNVSMLHLTQATVFEEMMPYCNITSNESMTYKGNNTTKSESPYIAIIYLYLGSTICALGMLCNILNLIVLSRPELNNSPYIYLIALSCTDMGLLTLSFIQIVLSRGRHTYFWTLFDIYIFYPLSNIFFTSSIFITVLLTIERFFIIYQHITTQMTLVKVRIRVFTVILIACFINIPRYFCFEIEQNESKYYPQGSPFRSSELFYIISWFYAVIINFIPLIIVGLANTYLIYTVHYARKKRKELNLQNNRESEMQHDHRRLTITLISIVILFVICIIPSAFAEEPIAYMLFGGNKTWKEFLVSPENSTFVFMSNKLLFLNSSLNFVLYCVFNKKFRRVMTQLLFRNILDPIQSKVKEKLFRSRRKVSHTKIITLKISSISL
ncbi:hypothetical protein CHS0354_007970 [Potamilus streckersoni]|uniref:G-protein coupled receptors family 1 profile domain-containing protein n=1 Tax=Potamilus streckersoni TaxID=2493646 RepID=A0AAE0SBM6_9BIVA|nr:hypothetical protein CHS0354_007970 [Potamilus streckersoni]